MGVSVTERRRKYSPTYLHNLTLPDPPHTLAEYAIDHFRYFFNTFSIEKSSCIVFFLKICLKSFKFLYAVVHLNFRAG